MPVEVSIYVIKNHKNDSTTSQPQKEVQLDDKEDSSSQGDEELSSTSGSDNENEASTSLTNKEPAAIGEVACASIDIAKGLDDQPVQPRNIHFPKNKKNG